MDKICIVKLRKHITDRMDTWSGKGCGKKPESQRNETDEKGNARDGRVSLTLTRDQVDALRSDPRTSSLLYEKAQAVSGNLTPCSSGMAIRLELPPLLPVRLLTMEEVTLMLRVSKSSLRKILREGTLQSYRFGRLRRLMLDDVLSYLAAHQERPPNVGRVEGAKPSPTGMVQPYAIKEG